MPIPTIPAISLFVDTSGWADPVLGNTPDHARMETFYKQAIAGGRPLVTTNYVITELVALLTARSRASRVQVLSFIARVKQMPQVHIIHIDQSLDAAAWTLLERHSDKEWSLVDAASFVVMRQLALSDAFTSDHHFAQAGFIRLPQ